MHIFMFHNIDNLLVVTVYDFEFHLPSTRAVWQTAHAATTSSTVDENVLRPTPGIILPAASHSVFPPAGR